MDINKLTEKAQESLLQAKNEAERRITLELNPAALELLTNEGYDPVYGARPLKRAIQHLVLDPLALALLDGQFGDDSHIVAEAHDGELVFKTGEGYAGLAA